MKNFIQLFSIVFFLIFVKISIFSLDISKNYFDISTGFDIFTQKNEGETGFRSLLIPSGGRYEGLATTFTALSNDTSFFDANPAASAVLQNTEINFLHNSWIADSKLETFGYTQRKDNFGWGGSLRCFYIPFTEYGLSGDKLSSGFYSETFLTANFAYNFFAGHNFKGITVGGNMKVGLRSMPAVSGDSNGKNSKVKAPNGYAVLGDFGILLRANLKKKFYDREPNFHFGIMLKNFGIPINGEVAPAYISIGVAYSPVKYFLFSFDLKQNINVKNIKLSGIPTGSFGMMFSITKYFNILTGFGIRGGNPHFSLGAEVNLKNISINSNYTLDMATQTTNLNRISIGVKIALGDGGRKKDIDKLEQLYLEGLKEYKNRNYDSAIAIWKEVLSRDKKFDPAREAIEAAEKQKKLESELNKIIRLELE